MILWKVIAQINHFDRIYVHYSISAWNFNGEIMTCIVVMHGSSMERTDLMLPTE